jgi:exo-beta-1,3-glucanase (GH17 family)
MLMGPTQVIVASPIRSLTRVAALGACLILAACGDSQNYNSYSEYVTVGGDASGLTGTVTLLNTVRQTDKNGKTTTGTDTLSLAANGPFTFGLQVAHGSSYAVTVQTQPPGQFCEVTGGNGTATSNVKTVAVSCKSDVTIGGTISGLTGTVVLQNNGGNPLATASDGSFTFTSAVQSGSAYAVSVRTQPVGQVCSVTNGSGTANANVTNIAVVCAVFTLRPLPAIYATGQSVNYSAFRAGGPAADEVPSDADVLQDLSLLQTAGFNLLRLFGADDVSEKILRLAAANFPEMKFQQGIALAGIPIPAAASCQDPAGFNDRQIARAIALANTYTNVVTVAVGNETSFFSLYMPTPCLAGYINRVRNSVSQPVTTEDDWTFYAGLTTAGGDRASVRPDTILPLIDFAAIHTYPFLNACNSDNPNCPWDWRQTGVPAGQARAAAMMNAALGYAKNTYTLVANYTYTNAAGQRVTTGASLPITVGETGWKAVQTNPNSDIETYAALPVNEKWYYDLMNSWRESPGGPLTVFFFEAFDEAWKGIDDGWGLWTRERAPRYALCGTPAGSPCNDPVYEGAGYYTGP